MRRCGRMYLEVGTGAVNKFANSLIHRRRHRLIQTMLLLQAFTTQVTKFFLITCKMKTEFQIFIIFNKVNDKSAN